VRCPDCGKMASYDEPEVEMDNTEVDSDGNVTVEGRMTLRSACCNSDLKEWAFCLEGQVEHVHEEGKEAPDFGADDVEVTASDYYDNPGRPMRYRRHIYAAETTVNVTCVCGFKTEVELKDENQASGFDELV
jgi:hypothetical protein